MRQNAPNGFSDFRIGYNFDLLIAAKGAALK